MASQGERVGFLLRVSPLADDLTLMKTWAAKIRIWERAGVVKLEGGAVRERGARDEYDQNALYSQKINKSTTF